MNRDILQTFNRGSPTIVSAATANSKNATRIAASGSKIAVLVIPTDEERLIADETWSMHIARETIQ
jgi:acetate kinase